jgi:formate hydrogenlyase subunit 6/NADH:ubiquinone oxidoreductase subunit I
VAVCLPGALSLATPAGATTDARPEGLVLDYRRCIMCGLCIPACPAGALGMQPEYELAATGAADLQVIAHWTRNGEGP